MAQMCNDYCSVPGHGDRQAEQRTGRDGKKEGGREGGGRERELELENFNTQG